MTWSCWTRGVSFRPELTTSSSDNLAHTASCTSYSHALIDDHPYARVILSTHASATAAGQHQPDDGFVSAGEGQ